MCAPRTVVIIIVLKWYMRHKDKFNKQNDIFMCVYVCVCVCAYIIYMHVCRERERERERERDR